MFSPRTQWSVLAGLIIAYCLFFGTFTILRHTQFQTQAWDLGIFEQTFWNTVHGRIMQNTLEEIPNHLGIHMSPFLFLLVPLYAIFQSPYFLLIAQTVALAAGAIPLYFLALSVLGRTSWALLLAGAYLLYPPLHWVNGFDFHEIAFFVPLILAAFYYIEKRNWTWAWVFLALAASTKEDAILMVAAVGLWLFLLKKSKLNPAADTKNPSSIKFWTPERIHGAILAGVCLAYFLVATKFIMPSLGGGLLRLDRYAALGASAPEILKNLFIRPSLALETFFSFPKLAYIFWLLFPLAFLPLLSWRSFLFLALPGILENTLTSYAPQFSGIYQYDAVLVGGLLVGTLYGLRIFSERWPRLFPRLFWILGATMLIGFLARSPLSPFKFPVGLLRENPQSAALRSIVRAIPNDASISVPTTLVPHLSNREHIYMLGTEPYWINQQPFKPDIVIIDGGDLFGFYTPEALQTYADSYGLSGLYKLTVLEKRYFIFVRKTFTTSETAR